MSSLCASFSSIFCAEGISNNNKNWFKAFLSPKNNYVSTGFVVQTGPCSDPPLSFLFFKELVDEFESTLKKKVNWVNLYLLFRL